MIRYERKVCPGLHDVTSIADCTLGVQQEIHWIRVSMFGIHLSKVFEGYLDDLSESDAKD